MDGREAMAMPGPSSYYIRGLGAPGPGPQPGLHGPLSIRTMPNQSPSLGGGQSGGHIGGGSGGSIGSGFQLDSSSSMSMLPHGMNVVGGSMAGQGEPVKRKRGRPRKYGPDGNVALALSPLSATPPTSGSVSGSVGTSSIAGSGSGMPKRGRGRPPGTGRKQQLASLGEWVSGSAGIGFTPHIITIAVGEDIASKIMSFSQQGPRAVCILSANGAVSTVTLRQPATSGGTVTYEGRFEILCMSGSYLMADEGGSRNRSGGLSIALSSPDGRMIGGGVGGLLIAATPVQVIVGSFLYGGSKMKNKPKTDQESSGTEHELSMGDKLNTPISSMPSNTISTPLMGGWPGSRAMDLRNALDIDLTRG